MNGNGGMKTRMAPEALIWWGFLYSGGIFLEMKTLKEQIVHSLCDGMKQNSGKEMHLVEEKDGSILAMVATQVECLLWCILIVSLYPRTRWLETKMWGEIWIGSFSINWISSPLILRRKWMELCPPNLSRLRLPRQCSFPAIILRLLFETFILRLRFLSEMKAEGSLDVQLFFISILSVVAERQSIYVS